MINNSSLKKYHRLSQKQLNSQFTQAIMEGMQCSPFEAGAILDTVHKVYSPYFQSNGGLKPGQILFQVLSVDNSPSTNISDSKQITVKLTLDDPEEDLEIRKKEGVVGLRQHRLERVSNETFQQGGLLTVEDLAYRLFNCGERTICRDLSALRKRNIILPLRSTVHDMGRAISHRLQIVKCWLKGQEYFEIARNTCHGIASVKNYIEKFKRVVALSEENYDVHTIGFLVNISASLVEEYYKIYRNESITLHREEELKNYVKKNSSNIAEENGGQTND